MTSPATTQPLREPFDFNRKMPHPGDEQRSEQHRSQRARDLLEVSERSGPDPCLSASTTLKCRRGIETHRLVSRGRVREAAVGFDPCA